MTDLRQSPAPADNLAKVKAFYQGWDASRGGNAEEMFALLDERIALRTVLSPDVPHELARPHDGLDEARRYFAEIKPGESDWTMLYYKHDREIVDSTGDGVALVGRFGWLFKPTGRVLESPKVDIWRFNNGRATQFLEMFDSLAAVHAIDHVTSPYPIDSFANPSLRWGPDRCGNPRAPGQTESNADRLMRTYAAWRGSRAGNVGDVLDIFDDEIEMRSVLSRHIPHGIAGTHRGKKEAAAYFAALGTDLEMLAYDTDFVIAENDQRFVVVGSCEWRHRGNGRTANGPKVDIWHFENGRATHFFELLDSYGFARVFGFI